jgi:carboxypeptidase family protein
MLCAAPISVIGLGMLGSAAYGQSAATIAGTVSDPTGAIVQNARVTLTNESNGFVRSATSNDAGIYSAPDLEVGVYRIEVQAPGFKDYVQKDITLNVATALRIDIKLQLGAVGTTVTVEANAVQVQADTSDVSQTITETQIANLSTNGRNILQLTALVPGAASNMPDFDLPGAQWQNRSIYFNGMRQDANNWIIDGGEAYDRGGGGILLVSPSQDAIGEFKIQTSNYAADEGNSSGGMTSMELKSGTRQFHASAWEYNRNDAFDAYSYLSKQVANPTKPELRYNAYGFNAGGPVQFRSSNPKTFFFYNMEWRKLIQGGSIYNQVPTAAEYGGNMTGFGYQVYVPNTTDPGAIAKFAADGLKPGDPFPNDTIPSNLIDPTTSAYLKAGYMLTPNASDGIHYFSSANTVTPYREEIARVDHQFSEKQRVMGSLIWDGTTQQAPTVAWAGNTFPTVGSLETVPSWQGVVRWTDSVRPSLLNEVGYNTTGNNITIANTGLWHEPTGYNTQPLFTPNPNTIDKVPGMDFSTPSFSVNMDNGNWPWKNYWRSNSWWDNISYDHGTHNFKFGVEYMYTDKKQQIFTDTSGTYHFYGEATACSVNCSGTQPGNGLADMLLGFANDFGQAEIQDYVNAINNRYDVYGMDDWRATRRLTLNIGLRWEGLPHAYDQNERLSNFYPGLWSPSNAATFAAGSNGVLCTSQAQTGCAGASVGGFTTVPNIALSKVLFFMNGIGLSGRNGIPKGLTTNHWNNIGPRVGFEYDVFGDGKTILRGGGGIFFEENAGNEEYNMGANLPFNNSSSTSRPYLDTPATSWVNGAAAGTSPTTPQGFTGVQEDLPITDVYQFNLGVQRQLRNNMVGTLGFVGNISDHLSQQADINSVPLNDPNRLYICGTTCGSQYTSTNPAQFNTDYNRIYQGWDSINLIENEGNSHYEGMQATLRATSFHNLSIDLAYTYSHAWDVDDGQLFNPLDNPQNPHYTYGTAGFDRRQIGALNFDYNVPFFEHSGAAARDVLGGWTISGVSSMVTGNPLTIDGPNTTGLPSTTNHANLIGPITYTKTFAHWFDPTAFAESAPLTFGNAPKSVVKGPGRDAWQLSLFKDFHFTERSGFQFRAAAFNVFNHTQFTGVNTSVLTGSSTSPYSGTAGQINATADPREFQFGGKVYF